MKGKIIETNYDSKYQHPFGVIEYQDATGVIKQIQYNQFSIFKGLMI